MGTTIVRGGDCFGGAWQARDFSIVSLVPPDGGAASTEGEAGPEE